MRLYTITHKQSGEIVAMVEASTPAQAYARLCQSDYEISVTRAIDVSAHVRNNGRVITPVVDGDDSDQTRSARVMFVDQFTDFNACQKPLEPEFAQLLTANMRELTRDEPDGK